MEATLLSKWEQRDEGGEEERIKKRVGGQDPSDGGDTGGDTQERDFCMHPETLATLRE